MPKYTLQANNEENIKKWGFGKRVPKTEENEFGWEDVTLEDISSGEPIILCFGGNGTITKEFANGIAKIAKSLLGTQSEKNYVDTYSIYYNYDKSQEKNQNKDPKATKTGSLFERDIEEITRKLFIPRVTDKEGNRLSVMEASKNMRNVNILAHCYGEIIADRIAEKTADIMKTELKYSEDEVKQTLSQILSVSYAPYGPRNRYTTNFEVKSLNDKEFGFNYEIEIFKNDDERYVGIGEFKEKDNTLSFYTSSLFGEEGRLINPEFNDHNSLSELSRDRNWQNDNKRTDPISRTMALALALGVTSSRQQKIRGEFVPLPDIHELKKFLQPEIEEAKNSKFEQKDKEIWDYRQNEVSFDQLLKLHNVTEKDIINNKVSYSKISYGFKKVVIDENSPFAKINSSYFTDFLGKRVIDKSKAKNLDSMEAIVVNLCKNAQSGIILHDGDLECLKSDSKQSKNKWLEQVLMKIKLSDKNLDDSVIFDIAKDKDKSKIKVHQGVDFEKKEFESVQDMFSSLKKAKQSETLSENQTRVLLNMAQNRDIALQDIILPKGVSLDSKVLKNEVEISKNGAISPKNTQTKSKTEQSF